MTRGRTCMHSSALTVSFYCRECRLDADFPAFKEENQYGQWFAAKCPSCGHKLIRHITDKMSDPYWHSPKMIEERRKHAVDILQPGQYGFQTYYKDAWNRIEKASEEWELKKKREKESIDKFYKQSLDKNFAKKAISLEEKIEHGTK